MTLPKLNLLYAEDNPMDADLVREQLSQVAAQVHVQVVDSGRLCIERLASGTFDMLLLDNRLRDIDGLEVLVELARRNIDLPIVMVTGTGDERVVVQSLRLGALDYVPKGARWLQELPGVLARCYARYQQAAGRRRSKARRVAYVEHSTTDVDLTVRHFAEHARHIHIVPIRSAEEALRIFSGSHDFDLLLVDLRMPGMSALEMIREIERTGELPPTIVVSGHGDDAAAIAALRLGAFDYISKRPGYLEQLPHTIDHAIDRRVLEHGQALLEKELEERRLAERALRESELRFQALWESAVLGLVLGSKEGVIQDANDAFLRIVGRSRAEVAARTSRWDELGPTETRESDRAELRSLLETGSAPLSEKSFVRADGQQVPVLVGFGRLDGGFLAYVLELTEQHALRAQLEETQRLEALGRLAGGVAHDINNLLTVASMGLELLSSGGAPSPELTMIRDAISGSSRITRELLAFGRRAALRVEPVDVPEMLRELFGGVLRSLGEHIQVDLALPSEPLMALGDKTALERIIVNLVANARDAMLQGGTLRVLVDEQVPPDASVPRASAAVKSWVRISVEDTGEGIPPELLPRVFEPFVSTRAAGHGTGLGLATVYGIVKDHGGVVRIESTQNVRTCVDVYLPAAETEPASPEARAPAAEATAEKLTILLVEDDRNVRKIASHALRRLGHTVLEAEDGPAAERLLQEATAPIDVVVTDNMLPGGIFGLQVIARLRERVPGLAAVVISGVDLPVSEREVFLAKPFTSTELLRAVEEARRKPGSGAP